MVIESELNGRLAKVFDDVFSGSISVDDPAMRDKEQAWPSMKHIALVIALEQEFGLRLSGEEAAEMTTITRIASALAKRIGMKDEN